MDILKGYKTKQAPLIKIPNREKKEYAFKETDEKKVLWRLKDIPFKNNYPNILITPSYKKGYYGIWEDLANALLKFKFNIIISPFLTNEETEELLDKKFFNGVVLSGGNDITPQIYGGEKKSAHKPDLRRDNFEIILYKKSLEKRLPVLAVCRGLQVVNIAHGGTLKSGFKIHKKNSRHNAHLLKIRIDSLLRKISNAETLRVGTSHHQAVGKLGKNLISIAEAEDGVIEMIELKDYPLIATQFHPERSQDGDIIFDVFRKLVQAHKVYC